MAKIDPSIEYFLSAEFKKRIERRLQVLADEIETQRAERERRQRRLNRLSFGLLGR